MTAGLTGVFTTGATTQAQRALAWWPQNRPVAPDLLEQELRNVLALVAAAPTLGAVARDLGVNGVRRDTPMGSHSRRRISASIR